MLQNIEILPTRQLPNLAAQANVPFDPRQQINFGKDVLTWIQKLTGNKCVYTCVCFASECTIGFCVICFS